MTEEQRKWYAMGANDMEAGRLVTEVEKWRQYQHKAANEAWKWKARADAAETRLAEVEKERDELRGWRNRANDLEVSMARARELAEGPLPPYEIKDYAERKLAKIARILSGDECWFGIPVPPAICHVDSMNWNAP